MRNPIYGLLHEACWADGGRDQLVGAAHPPGRCRPSTSPASTSCRGCSRASEARARSSPQHEWPRLYDPEVLARNTVPTAATIYTEDLYVERAFAEQTAAAIPNFRAWITSEYDHNGLRVDGERILTRLLDLVRGRV